MVQLLKCIKTMLGLAPVDPSWNEADISAVIADRSAEGILIHVGYVDDMERFLDKKLQSAVSESALIAIAVLKKTFDRNAQTILGFNSEQMLINSRFHIAIGVPYAPPAGKSLTDCLNACVASVGKTYSDVAIALGLKPIRLAFGISSGMIHARYRLHEINLTGQPYFYARDLMQWTEERRFKELCHQVTIDSATFDLLDAETKVQYKRHIRTEHDGQIADIMGDIYERLIPMASQNRVDKAGSIAS